METSSARRKTFWKQLSVTCCYLQPLTKIEKCLKAFKGSLGFPFTGSDTLNSDLTVILQERMSVYGPWRQILMEILACARCWKVFQMNQQTNSFISKHHVFSNKRQTVVTQNVFMFIFPTLGGSIRMGNHPEAVTDWGHLTCEGHASAADVPKRKNSIMGHKKWDKAVTLNRKTKSEPVLTVNIITLLLCDV